jgi:hypothetical protein
MYLAEKTVKNYVSNLLAKLGMERRTQAAIFAARLSERSTQETRRPRHLTAVAGTDSSWRRRSVLGVGCCLQRDAAVHERLLQAARSCRGCSNRLGLVAMPRASASSSRATS